MAVQFTYSLTGPGWAECALEIGKNSVVLTASSLSNALESLLESIVGILRGEKVTHASFSEEPGEYRWVLTALDDQHINIKVLYFKELTPDSADESGRVIFDADTASRSFGGAVLAATQKMMKEIGIQGYGKQWGNNPFPKNLQTELKKLLGDGAGQ